MADTNTNGWMEYKNRVIFQLDQLGTKTDSIEKKLDALREDVVVLKVKASLYGAAAAFIVTVIVQVLGFLLTHGKVA
jgi:hypothetical protein